MPEWAIWTMAGCIAIVGIVGFWLATRKSESLFEFMRVPPRTMKYWKSRQWACIFVSVTLGLIFKLKADHLSHASNATLLQLMGKHVEIELIFNLGVGTLFWVARIVMMPKSKP